MALHSMLTVALLLPRAVDREERRHVVDPLDEARARAEWDDGVVAGARAGVRARGAVRRELLVDDAQELHDALVQVEVLAPLEQVGVRVRVRVRV